MRLLCQLRRILPDSWEKCIGHTFMFNFFVPHFGNNILSDRLEQQITFQISTEKRTGPYVRIPLLLLDSKQNFNMSTNFSIFSYYRILWKLFSRSRSVRMRDWQTDNC